MQVLANFEVQAKSGPSPISVDQVFLADSHAHPLLYCLRLVSGRAVYLRQRLYVQKYVLSGSLSKCLLPPGLKEAAIPTILWFTFPT